MYKSVSIIIPVGGNRIKDIDSLTLLVNSILSQSYLGSIEIILVADSEINLWKELPSTRSIKTVPFLKPTSHLGRDTTLRIAFGWEQATGDILGMTGVSVSFQPDVVSRAVSLLEISHVDAVDGISVGSNDFFGKFQDQSLIAEFPKYGGDFLLNKKTAHRTQKFPTMVSFFMKREFYNKIKCNLPIKTEHGWDDYNHASMMIECGGTILCSDNLVTIRNHKDKGFRKLRLWKQFTSGISGMLFCVQNPENNYAKRRFFQAFVVLFTTYFVCFSLLISILVETYFIFGVLFLLLVLGGILNVIKAKNFIAFFFTPLNILQVVVWAFGFWYIGACDFNGDSELTDTAHKRR